MSAEVDTVNHLGETVEHISIPDTLQLDSLPEANLRAKGGREKP